MWKEHVALTTTFPEASLPPGGGIGAVSPDAVRRKRLVYRSKQRGWLEVREERVGEFSLDCCGVFFFTDMTDRFFFFFFGKETERRKCML